MKKIILVGLFGLSSIAMAVSAQNTHGSSHDGHAAQDIASLPVSTELSVSACWVRSLPLPAPSAGYFVVKNTGKQAVKLLSAASASYGMVMLHQTTNVDGLSKMSMADTIDIPAGGELEFKPGGYHAMLEKPTAEIKIGSTIAMEFAFDNKQKAQAECEVKPAKTMAH